MATNPVITTVPPRTALPVEWSIADLQRHLGGIPLERIRLYPPPGMATQQDALEVRNHSDRICELIDGVLVVKAMGSYESFLAGVLIQLLNNYLDTHRLGIVLGPDGGLQVLPMRMRIPDVSFIRWERFPDRRLPRDRVFRVAPDLAVEILSAGNTEGEMRQKLADYFSAGTALVWYIDPDARRARAYTAPDKFEEFGVEGLLRGGDVLPGFEIHLGDLLDRVPREP